MTDRDLLGPVDPAGPRRRRPGARALGSVSEALARLVPRPRGDDGSYDAGTGIPMSDEELREAFRVASLTVTPAPLGRPSRREEPPPPEDTSGDSGRDVSSPLRAPIVAPPPAEAATAPARPTVAPPPAEAATAPARPAGMAAMSAVPANGSRLDPAPDAARPIAPLPQPGPADQVQLPANLGVSVDDFFGGLVRRIERRF